MKISEFDNEVKLVDFENFFEIYENKYDKRKPYVYNLNSTVYFKGVPKKTFRLKHDMFWTTISYELYNTTRLWWILMKVNNVDTKNLFEPVRADETVKYLEIDVVRSIISTNLN